MTKDEALKLALEALEANHFLIHGSETKGGLAFCMDGYYSGCFDIDSNDKQTNEAITAIKEALAQSEQDGKCKYCTDGCPACDASKLPEQEPVACKECHLKDTVYDLLGDLKAANLKLSVRAKRTWVGLTDIDYAGLPLEQVGLVRWAEAKLKEKNT
jgi:hypothetical protein